MKERNVYILGAGFSACAGAPLIHGFLDRARGYFDNPDSGLDDYERVQFGNVFEFRQRMAQSREKMVIDLDNIEQLFGLAEMSRRLEKKGTKTRNSMVYVIAKTLELSIESPASERPLLGIPPVSGEDFSTRLHLQESRADNYQYIELYDYVAGLIAGRLDGESDARKRNDAVITFNYDLVLDDALQRIGVRPKYHLSDSDVDERRNEISLLKLHGSTNWAICGYCQDKESMRIGDEKMTMRAASWRETVCPKCSRKEYIPLLIPPSWDKSEYRALMEPVWRKAVEVLSQATRICCIGYSIPETDIFFKYLLSLGLAGNPKLYKFVVVDLVPQEDAEARSTTHKGKPCDVVELRYRSLLDDLFQKRRFSFYSMGLVRFVSQGLFGSELARGTLVKSQLGVLR